MPAGEHPLAPTDRGAYGFDDECVARSSGAHRLVALEPGRALLEEGVHPLTLVRRGEREREPVDLAGEGSGERLRRGPDCRVAWPTATAQLGREAMLAASSTAASSRSALGWTCVTRPARSASSELTNRPVRISSFAKPIEVARASRCVPPQPGDDPEGDLGLSEPGRVGRDADVAREGDLTTAAEGEPVDGRHDRGAEALDQVRDPVAALGERPGLEGRGRAHVADVGARRRTPSPRRR